MDERVIEPGEVEGPPGLPPIELLRGAEVLEVFVVRPDLDRVFRALQEVSPFLQRTDDRQQLLVVYLVIPLDCKGNLRRRLRMRAEAEAGRRFRREHWRSCEGGSKGL